MRDYVITTNILRDIIFKILEDNCFQQFENLSMVHQIKRTLSQPFPGSAPGNEDIKFLFHLLSLLGRAGRCSSMFHVIKSLVAPEFPERKGCMGDGESAGREAGLEAGQAQEVYYLWFLDSHSSREGFTGSWWRWRWEKKLKTFKNILGPLRLIPMKHPSKKASIFKVSLACALDGVFQKVRPRVTFAIWDVHPQAGRRVSVSSDTLYAPSKTLPFNGPFFNHPNDRR